MPSTSFSRRAALSASGAALFMTQWFDRPGLFADELMTPTPPLTEGPFYPDRLPLDRDNDLIIIGDSTTPAIGSVTHLTGRIVSPSGTPLKNATMEIWQCDANAVYLHTRDSEPKKEQQDTNFQGYGKFETATDGAYRFRTIKPVPYPGRPAPHIHIKVSQNGHEILTTQLMMRGFKGNERDGVFRNAGDKASQELVLGDFKKLPESKIGEYACEFDIVIGRTPDDREIKQSDS